MRILTDFLIGFAIAECAPAPQEPQLLIDQTAPESIAAHVQSQALASVAAANKLTVADVETKIAAGDAETKKALDEAKKVEHQKLFRWQSAMTYKFVGALQVFKGRPIVEDVGNATDDAATSTLEPSNTDGGSTPTPGSTESSGPHPEKTESTPHRP